MKRINFALISDVVFFTLCAFLVGFTAIRYFFKSALTALIASLGIALCAGVVSFFILYSKRRRRIYLSLGESEKKSLALHLSVCSEREVYSTFLKALDGAYAVGNRLEDGERAYYFNFKLSMLSPDDVAAVIREEGEKIKRIFCCDATPEAAALAEDFSVELCFIGEIYALLKERGALPERYALGKIKKPSVFKRIKKRLNRRLCPSLFFSGLTLLAFSFFTFYPIYYVVAGSLLVIASAALLFVPQSS